MSDNKLLLPDTTASVFQPRLAAWIGINEAITLQHVHYLAGKEDFGAVVEGIKWIRMTIEEWTEELPCFDARTVRRTLDNLEGDGLLVSRTFSGRSKWYRVNYELLSATTGPVERLQNRSELRVKAAKTRHNVTVQSGHIGDVSVQSGHLQLSKVDNPTVQSGQLPRPLPRPLSDTLSPNGDSGQKPPEGKFSEKWNKVNKTIVGNSFLDLTHLKPPPVKSKTAGHWWGWLFELFEMGNKDPTETCRIMAVVVEYMQKEHLTISSPKSLHNLARAVASGQTLNGVHKNGYTKTTQSNHRTGPAGAPVSASGLGEWTEDEKRLYGIT